jgi:hypothetical protein
MKRTVLRLTYRRGTQLPGRPVPTRLVYVRTSEQAETGKPQFVLIEVPDSAAIAANTLANMRKQARGGEK